MYERVRRGLLAALAWTTLQSAMAMPLYRNPLPGAALSASDGEPGQLIPRYDIPGRKLGSQVPWEFFLGNAAHRLIAYIYGVNHPGGQIFCNKETLLAIVGATRIGNVSLLFPNEVNMRPDITDLDAFIVFEIKPWNARGLESGRQEIHAYVAAINRTLPPGRAFSPGTGFQGEILVRFAQGSTSGDCAGRPPSPGWFSTAGHEASSLSRRKRPRTARGIGWNSPRLSCGSTGCA